MRLCCFFRSLDANTHTSYRARSWVSENPRVHTWRNPCITARVILHVESKVQEALSPVNITVGRTTNRAEYDFDRCIALRENCRITSEVNLNPDKCGSTPMLTRSGSSRRPVSHKIETTDGC